MFFSSGRKAAEPPSARDSGVQTASPSKKQGGAGPGAAAPSGILSVLIFNPTLLPESSPPEFDAQTAEQREDEGEENADGPTKEELAQEAKIVYSYPPNREPEERRSQAGLLEGLLMFSK